MKYTKEQLENACKTSKSYRRVLFLLGLKEAGGNYTTLKQNIIKNNIDVSHFTGKGWNKELKFIPNPKTPITDLLVKNSTYQSNKLRKRLLNENYFDYKCYNCNLSEWMGVPIKLELEHIDGDHHNNLIENLTLLCPNCHSLTSSWRKRKS